MDNSGKGGKSGKEWKRQSWVTRRKTALACHKCGKYGHFACDCRVRAVEENESATAHAGDKSSTSTNSKSATMNRVSFASSTTCSKQLDLEISEMDSLKNFSTSQVNMISCQQHQSQTPLFNHMDTFLTTFSGDFRFGEGREDG